jgi:hypothetical protein
MRSPQDSFIISSSKGDLAQQIPKLCYNIHTKFLSNLDDLSLDIFDKETTNSSKVNNLSHILV